MTITGKPIAILACLQICAAFLFYVGGVLGTHTVARLYEGAISPSITQFCSNYGLWPLIFPLIWTALIFSRVQRDASTLELSFWLTAAVIFCIWAAGAGIFAVVTPFANLMD